MTIESRQIDQLENSPIPLVLIPLVHRLGVKGPGLPLQETRGMQSPPVSRPAQ